MESSITNGTLRATGTFSLYLIDTNAAIHPAAATTITVNTALVHPFSGTIISLAPPVANTKALTGALSFIGTFTKTRTVFFTAALAFSGALRRAIGKKLTAALNFVGTWGVLYVINAITRWQLVRFDAKSRPEEKA